MTTQISVDLCMPRVLRGMTCSHPVMPETVGDRGRPAKHRDVAVIVAMEMDARMARGGVTIGWGVEIVQMGLIRTHSRTP